MKKSYKFMGRSALGAVLAAAAVLTAGLGAPAALTNLSHTSHTSSTPPPPPPYGTGELMGIEAENNAPTSMPPGIVNGPCTLGAEHPYPVVLVHGTFANAAFSWQTLAPMLADEGYCVFALNYGATTWTKDSGNHIYAVDSIENSAAELAWFVDDVVIPDTGASAVDIVGHSQGGMMPREFIEHDWDCSGTAVTENAFGEHLCAMTGSDATAGAPGATCPADSSVAGAACTHTLVGLAPSNHGADAYGLVPLFETLFGANSWTFPEQGGCGACGEQEAGNPFLNALNKTEATPGVLYYVIESADDEVVTPAPNAITELRGQWPSAYLHGPADHVLNQRLQDQCPTDATEHIGIIYDPVALQDVLAALADDGSTITALPAPSCPAVVPPLISG
ncbi:MAG: lipase family alpha/beta hydrolase [Acidimicrobiales bacterium]